MLTLLVKRSATLLLLFWMTFGPAGLAPQAVAEQPLERETKLDVFTLRRVTRNSGYIFAGTVMAIQPAMSSHNKLATVRITFRVDHAVHGVRRGQSLTMREWAGLWESGERYRVGQRLFLFLYPPSKLGLTSPVGGWQGRFTLDSQGEFIVGQEHTIANPILRNGRELRLGVREFGRAIQQAEEER
ncbi:MAG TPA: hypothetical protein VFA74_05070 [Terriglobales bacterium]|nr:hypothetical protein [Terriglobales bacterium]